MEKYSHAKARRRKELLQSISLDLIDDTSETYSPAAILCTQGSLFKPVRPLRLCAFA
jgi:hypothetical protein